MTTPPVVHANSQRFLGQFMWLHKSPFIMTIRFDNNMDWGDKYQGDQKRRYRVHVEEAPSWDPSSFPVPQLGNPFYLLGSPGRENHSVMAPFSIFNSCSLSCPLLSPPHTHKDILLRLPDFPEVSPALCFLTFPSSQAEIWLIHPSSQCS